MIHEKEQLPLTSLSEQLYTMCNNAKGVTMFCFAIVMTFALIPLVLTFETCFRVYFTLLCETFYQFNLYIQLKYFSGLALSCLELRVYSHKSWFLIADWRKITNKNIILQNDFAITPLNPEFIMVHPQQYVKQNQSSIACFTP